MSHRYGLTFEKTFKNMFERSAYLYKTTLLLRRNLSSQHISQMNRTRAPSRVPIFKRDYSGIRLYVCLI